MQRGGDLRMPNEYRNALLGIIIFFMTIVFTVSLTGCSSTPKISPRIDDAIEEFIDIQRKTMPKRQPPVASIYLEPCLDPSPPETADMLSYEVALRDAVVAYKVCRDSKRVLIDIIKERQDEYDKETQE